MASGFFVNTEAVQRHSGQFKSVKGEFDTKLNQLRGIMSQLEADFKTSQASGAFQERYQTWNASAANVTKSLESMSRFLNAVATGTTNWDQDLTKAAKGGGGGAMQR